MKEGKKNEIKKKGLKDIFLRLFTGIPKNSIWDPASQEEPPE